MVSFAFWQVLTLSGIFLLVCVSHVVQGFTVRRLRRDAEAFMVKHRALIKRGEDKCADLERDLENARIALVEYREKAERDIHSWVSKHRKVAKELRALRKKVYDDKGNSVKVVKKVNDMVLETIDSEKRVSRKDVDKIIEDPGERTRTIVDPGQKAIDKQLKGKGVKK